MSIASRVEHYLVEQGVEFDVISHPYSSTSMESAQLAHVPGDCIAKSVVLEDDRGYVLAVLPASCHVDLGELHRQTNRNLGLATEYELDALFADCEPGAVPPLGAVYEMDTIIDDGLAEQSDIYFEAGDHERLIHVSGETFEMLMGDVQHSEFSRHM
jgi:Ala-tRNA(Pro) deacylase